MRRSVLKSIVPAAAVAGFLLALASFPAAAQDRVDDFKTHCVSCHTIGGGRLVGPDLRDVAARKDREWLVKFIVDPLGVINSGDPYATQLRDEARGALMTAVPGMNPERAMNLLDLIEAESLLEKSQFVGLQLSDRPFTAEDVAHGRELFIGTRALANRGAACVSCHQVNGLGLLSGKKLAPDLNEVYERLNGRKGLATWLSAPATPTMQAVFADTPLDSEEILPLVAFLADKAEAPPESSQPATLIFVLAGLAGTVLTLLLFDIVWRKRLRGVRAPLVHGTAAQGKG